MLERYGVAGRYFGISLIVVALAYGIAAIALHHGSLARLTPPVLGTVGPHALPFFSVGFLLGALGLGLSANQERPIVVAGFLLGALQYAGSALVLRQSLFGYPLSWTLAAAHVVAMTMTPLESHYYGLGLLPGIALYLVVGESLRRRLDLPGRRAGGRGAIDAWSTPFYLALCIGTVAVVVFSQEERELWAASWWAFVAVYGIFTTLFRHPAWLYPTLGGFAAAYLAALGIFSDRPSLGATALALAFPVWLFFWLADGILRTRAPLSQPRGCTFLGAGQALAGRWSAPPLAWGALLLFVSALASLPDAAYGFPTAITYALLLGIFACLWRSEVEACAALAFAAILLQQWMRLTHLPFADQPPRWAAAAFALALAAVLLRRWPAELAKPWVRPLHFGSIGIGAAAMLLAGGRLSGVQTHPDLQVLAATTALYGLTVIAHGVDRRARLAIYLGVALVEAGYMTQLLYWKVGQLQAFALPAGLYLMVVGYLEWRGGTDRQVKGLLELGALAVLLGASLIQAVGFLGDGLDRYRYDTFLFLEGLALLGLGASLRWKRSFFAAVTALVVDVFIMLADPIRAMNSWYLVAATGLIIIPHVVFIEQRRQQIPLWIEEWRSRLESWD